MVERMGWRVIKSKYTYSHVGLWRTFCPEANLQYNKIIKEKKQLPLDCTWQMIMDLNIVFSQTPKTEKWSQNGPLFWQAVKSNCISTFEQQLVLYKWLMLVQFQEVLEILELVAALRFNNSAHNQELVHRVFITQPVTWEYVSGSNVRWWRRKLWNKWWQNRYKGIIHLEKQMHWGMGDISNNRFTYRK